MEILMKYSGITAIFVYGAILYILLKFQSRRKKRPAEAKEETVSREALNIDDEDAVVACLTAAIDLRNESRENVRVVSVRRIA